MVDSTFPLDTIEVCKDADTRVFGGVYAANDGFIAEIHEQHNGEPLRLRERSRCLPSREVALAWMRSREVFRNAA